MTQEARDDERECVEAGCTGFPDATWDRCAKHQDDLESRVAGRPVPTTEMIRRYYARAPIAFREDGSVAREATTESIAFCERQFDRWLDAHDAEVVASVRKHPEPNVPSESHEARYDGEFHCVDCGEVMALCHSATSSARWVHRVPVGEGEQ